MIRLADNFYITSIDRSRGWEDRSKLVAPKVYTFRYKEYKIEAKIKFSLLGYTKEDNMSIINFGYDLDIRRWSNKEQRFEYIDLDGQNGRETKKYFDSKEAREMLLRFIERDIDKYLEKISPAIIIRGALSDIKINLPRYKRFDAPFSKHHYIKRELDISESDSLYQITYNKQKDDKAIWVYCKKESSFDKLNSVFK